MYQLFVSVSLDAFHKWVYLQLLVTAQFHFLLFNFLVDILLVHLNFYDFELVSFLSEFISFDVFLDREVFSFSCSQFATLTRQGEGVVAVKHVGSELDGVKIMLVSHSLQRHVGSCLILLHVAIPGTCELLKLCPLNAFNLFKLHWLSKLHLSDLSLQFNLGNSFEFVVDLLDFSILLFKRQVFNKIFEKFHESCDSKVRKAEYTCFG